MINLPGVSARVLIVAATERELKGAGRVESLVCGVGPESTRTSVAKRLRPSEGRPRVVLHVGIAGARRASEIPILSTVIGSASVDCDGELGRIEPDRELLRRTIATLSNARVLPIGTSARVGGTRSVDVEAMEGYAVLSACAAFSVPAVEVRVISNEIEEPDRAKWRFDDAFAELAARTSALVEAFRR